MPKKVSEEQMEELFAFTRKHFVEHYDLQTELADHMANAIEDRWTTDPTLDFARAKEQEFKKFGVFGFMGVVEERQIALNKKYQKLIWSYFKEFFKLPRIVLTILLIFAVHEILELSTLTYSVILLTVVVVTIYKLTVTWRKYRKRVKQTGKKWMFEEIIMRCGGIPAVLYFPYEIVCESFDTVPGMVSMWVMSIFLVISILYLYIIFYIIPSKAEEHLVATYPEYNLKF